MLPPSAIIQKGGFSMTEHEKYQEHIRHTHDAFCKTVIRHAAIDAARSIRSRRKREISLEYLIEEKHYPFSTTDKYFAEQSGMTSYPLFRLWSDGAFGKSRACRSPVRTITDGTGNHFLVLLPTIDA